VQGRAVPTADWPFAHAERLLLTIDPILNNKYGLMHKALGHL